MTFRPSKLGSNFSATNVQATSTLHHLFRLSPSESVSPDPDIEDETSWRQKYDLRHGDRLRNFSTSGTWLDQDLTATYDPTGKDDPGLRPPVELLTGRKRTRDEADRSNDEHRSKLPRVLTWQYGRYEGKRLPLVFTFKAHESLEKLASFGSYNTWPASDLGPSNGIDWRNWWQGNLASFQQDHGLEARSRNKPQDLKHDALCYDVDISEVTLGHPAARGCKECFRLQERCPLVDGAKYPCDTCAKDEIECELIIEPTQKGSCLSCQKKRSICSYRSNDSNHLQPCENCARRGFKCVAGPANGLTRMGPSLDLQCNRRAKENQKVALSCAPCRASKKWCSFRRKGASRDGPCSQCQKNNKICTTEALLQSEREKTCPTHNLVTKSPDIHAIWTKLAHPLKFNCSEGECQWCEDQVYGILGLGLVEVEVKELLDGGDMAGAYIETAGGHTSMGHSPSQMCDWCTLERLGIAACKDHDIQPIGGLDPDTFDFETVTHWMAPGMAASAPFPWCSVCPSPAFFQCCKTGDSNEEMRNEEGGERGDNAKQEEKGGCGLMLCESCAATLVNEKAGDLGALVASLKEQDVIGGFSLRADAELLTAQGELLRRFENL